jgi:hypothetical protein
MMFRTPVAAELADQFPELFEGLDCDALAVRCTTCSGGVYGDLHEDHDQWCPLASRVAQLEDALAELNPDDPLVKRRWSVPGHALGQPPLTMPHPGG